MYKNLSQGPVVKNHCPTCDFRCNMKALFTHCYLLLFYYYGLELFKKNVFLSCGTPPRPGFVPRLPMYYIHMYSCTLLSKHICVIIIVFLFFIVIWCLVWQCKVCFLISIKLIWIHIYRTYLVECRTSGRKKPPNGWPVEHAEILKLAGKWFFT